MRFEVSGGRNRAGSTFAGIGDTVALGRVLYAGGFPIVLRDEFWIPSRERIIRHSIVPIGGIHIYIGETASSGAEQVSFGEETAARLEAIAKIRSEMQELRKGISASDPKKSNPTQSAPEQEKLVEDLRRSTWVSEVLEKQRCHFVNYLNHRTGPASPK
jgi:hypothetical protein